MFETTNQLLLFHLEEMDVSRGNQVWKHVDGCWIDAGWIPIRAPKTGSYKNPKRNETTRPTRHPKSQHCASKLLNPTFLCYLYAIDMLLICIEMLFLQASLGTSSVKRQSLSCLDPVFRMDAPSTIAPRMYSMELPQRQIK